MEAVGASPLGTAHAWCVVECLSPSDKTIAADNYPPDKRFGFLNSAEEDICILARHDKTSCIQLYNSEANLVGKGDGYTSTTHSPPLFPHVAVRAISSQEKEFTLLDR